MRNYDPRFKVNTKQTPVHAPATGEYRESWGVENPYGTMVWFESAEVAAGMLLVWADYQAANVNWKGRQS